MSIVREFNIVLVCTFFTVACCFCNAYGAAIPAFPGAVGYGSETAGGRGGDILEVTNLSSDGDGSFRQACETAGRRIIVFRTGGTIHLTRNIRIDDPHLTIAGQSAPGDGITIRGAGLTVITHDVVIRHLRIRVGDAPEGPSPENRDALQIEEGAYNVVVDHCSFSWAVDETVTFWSPDTRDCTVNNSIVSEALYNSIHPKGPHSKGSLVGQGIHNISYIGNLFAHNDERNPKVRFTTGVIVNNVVYDRGFKDIDIESSTSAQSISVQGNVFKKRDSQRYPTGSIYIRPGLIDGTRIFVGDNDCSSINSGNCIENRHTAFDPFVDTPPVWPSGLTAKPSSEVMEGVLADAGARPNNRDSVDVRIINQVRNGTGIIIDSQETVGGWPQLDNGVPEIDSDHDGIPDTWENERGLNPQNPADGREDRDQDGYTNVEEYLNALAGDRTDPQIPMPPQGLGLAQK